MNKLFYMMSLEDINLHCIQYNKYSILSQITYS